MVRSALNDFLGQSGQKHFIRVHRSFSVNLNKIDDIFPTELSVQGIKVPIGKSYRDGLFDALGIKDK
jgi:DNA-binding LytR/AlgR family response regulator